ncbi:MAG: glycosyltransferase family 39 protein [Candidatus Promineifilaceae bacterium]
MIAVPHQPTRRWAMLLIVLGGFVLRVYGIDTMSFWSDEVLTPLRSALSVREILSNQVVIQGIVSQDTHPPLYFLIIHLTRRLLGTSDLAYRFVAVVFGTLTIPVIGHFGRNLFNPHVGLIAAILMAINPLHIWYAQEARMYTLLVLCMLLASLMLWHAWEEHTITRLPRWVAAYTLFAGLAIYTHYTAAFLILAQGVVWLWILWSRQLWKLVAGILASGVVASLPLIPIVIPRLLAGEEASYYLISPEIFFLDVLRGFGFGRTADYTQTWTYPLLVLLGIVLLLGVWKARLFQRAFLLTYLLAATVGLLAGSYLFKPMYLGPHHMMVGLPAFVLLLAVAIVEIRPKYLTPLIALVVLTSQLTSLNNLYRNPNYAKDNYRDLVRYVDQHATDRDLVVYNSAILMPMQTHYTTRADLPVTTLPSYTTFATAETQAELAGTSAERIWFMSAPPPYPGDDDQLIRTVLDEQFFVADRHWFHGNNTEMLISAYAPRLTGSAPNDATLVDWQGSSQLPRLNAQRLSLGPEMIWVDLWWTREKDDDLAFEPLQFELRAPDGSVWQRGVWEFWAAEDSADLPNKLTTSTNLHTSYALAIPSALPPSSYQLWLNSRSASDVWHPLGDLEITNAPQPDTRTNVLVRFENGIELVGVQLAEESVRPGNAVPLTAYWRVTEPMTEAWQFQLRVNGPDGLIHDETAAIFPAWLAPEQVPLNTLIAKPLGIFPAANVAAGDYTLTWSVKSEASILKGRPRWRPWQSEINRSGAFRIDPFPIVTDLPADLLPLTENSFGDAVTLAGYELDRSDDETIELALYWESLAEIADDYWVFVHFSAEADQPPLTSSNSIPVGLTRPTSGWRVGEILQDTRRLTLPTELPSGTYQILLGFYHPETGQRLPVQQNGQALPFDQLQLTTITLP